MPSADAFPISVKRETGNVAGAPDGVVSNCLHDHYQQGDKIELALPSGGVALNIAEDANQPMVFVVGGVGITPIIAMLHQLFEREDPGSRPVYLFQCLTALAVLPFANELADSPKPANHSDRNRFKQYLLWVFFIDVFRKNCHETVTHYAICMWPCWLDINYFSHY